MPTPQSSLGRYQRWVLRLIGTVRHDTGVWIRCHARGVGSYRVSTFMHMPRGAMHAAEEFDILSLSR